MADIAEISRHCCGRIFRMKMERDGSKGGSRAVDIWTGGNIRTQLMDVSLEIKVRLASKAWPNTALSENAIQHSRVVIFLHWFSTTVHLPSCRNQEINPSSGSWDPNERPLCLTLNAQRGWFPGWGKSRKQHPRSRLSGEADRRRNCGKNRGGIIQLNFEYFVLFRQVCSQWLSFFQFLDRSKGDELFPLI